MPVAVLDYISVTEQLEWHNIRTSCSKMGWDSNMPGLAVFTETNHLSYIQSTAKFTTIEVRLNSSLAAFDFTITYTTGKSN